MIKSCYDENGNYDANNRLKNERKGDDTTTYTYDKNGNQFSKLTSKISPSAGNQTANIQAGASSGNALCDNGDGLNCTHFAGQN